MTTTVPSVHGHNTPTIEATTNADDTAPAVRIRTWNTVGLCQEDVIVDRAEFLRAVETELNVKIIDRADIPPVIESKTETKWEAGDLTWTYPPSTTNLPTAEGLHDRALAYLALAEHLEAHPPVDEAQVDALTDAIESAVDRDGVSLQESHPRALAHYLVQAGVRPPKAD